MGIGIDMGNDLESYMPTPLAEFGKDHASVLAYIETRCVNHRGVLKYDHLRGQIQVGGYGPYEYPTRLGGGEFRHHHNDFDVIGDLIHHLFVVTPFHDFLPFVFQPSASGLDEYVMDGNMFELTASGSVVAGDIRMLKADGGKFGDYAGWLEYEAEEEE